MTRTEISLLITLMAFADDIPYVRQHRNQELELVVVKRRVKTLEDTVSDDYNVERKVDPVSYSAKATVHGIITAKEKVHRRFLETAAHAIRIRRGTGPKLCYQQHAISAQLEGLLGEVLRDEDVSKSLRRA